MNPIDQIPMIAVSYNAPDLIAALLRTFRQHYPHNPVYIIDGSAPEIAAQIAPICAQYQGVTFIPFGYNIHHGPGMAWAIKTSTCRPRAVPRFRRRDPQARLPRIAGRTPGAAHVRRRQRPPVDENGFSNGPNSMPYLHPACMLTNIEVMRQWPLPVKHGAPMLPPMIALARPARATCCATSTGSATISATTRRSASSSATTGRAPCAAPAATTTTSRAPRRSTPTCCPRADRRQGGATGLWRWRVCQSLQTDQRRLQLHRHRARRHRRRTGARTATSSTTRTSKRRRAARPPAGRRQLLGAGRRAGTLRDPWAVLAKIRSSMAADGTLVLSVRNIQHWSAQVRLNMGDFRYREDGVMHKDELRQFTRGSLLELAADRLPPDRRRAGDPNEAGRDAFLPILRQLARQRQRS
jgi:hypothetical protein